MIKHIVFCNLKQNALGKTKEENAAVLSEKLMDLTKIIPEIKKMECGLNTTDAPGCFDFALYSEFETEEDLKTYQINPTHLEVKEFIGKIADGKAFVDYKI